MAKSTQFNSQFRQTIEAFAASMQFPSMPPAARDGSYTFVFEHSGVLSLLPASDSGEVVMALGRKPISDGEAFLRGFLLQASLEYLTTGPLHAGMTGDGLYCYATRVPADEFDLSTLEQNLKHLMRAHETAA